MVEVNTGASVQDSVESQSVFFRDIGIPVFCIFIRRKTSREGGSGFFLSFAVILILFIILVDVVRSIFDLAAVCILFLDVSFGFIL